MEKVKDEKIEPDIFKPYVQPEKISIQKLKERLNGEGCDYTDEEIEGVRTFCYQWVEIIFREYKRQLSKNNFENIKILKTESDDQESNFIRTCEYGRTG